MNITQEEVVDHQTVLHIELEDEDLDPYLDRGYKRVVQRTSIPGFRKGKAPRIVVERYVGRESLLDAVADFMVTDVTARAIDAQNLETVGMPKLELLELEPVTVKATVALRPDVDLGVYKDIRVDEEEMEIVEEDIQRRLDQLRESAGSWEPAERPVELGDLVTADMSATIDDATVLDQKGVILVADERGDGPFPGLGIGLAGAVREEPKKFTLAIPEDSDSDHAGQDVQFAVTVIEVKKRDLPELDDEFAKGVGDGYDSLDALREQVESQLRADRQKLQDSTYREAVLDAFVESASIELPPLLVEHEMEHMEADREQALDRMNIRMDDYLRYVDKSEEDLQDETRESAIDRIKRTLVLSTLAEADGLEVSDAEIDEQIEAMPEDPTSQTSRAERRARDSEEGRDSVRRRILIDKTIEQMLAIARGDSSDQQDEVPQADEDTEESNDAGGDNDKQT